MDRTEQIERVHDGFRRERCEDVETVRRWIGAVVHGGRWGFEDPEGVVQEILIKLLEIVRAGRVQSAGGFQKFVQQTARYTCVKQLHRERRRTRRERPEVDAEQVSDGKSPEENLERGERLELLRYVVFRLPESCRQLWQAVYVERRPSADLARELGITVNNLRVRVHRCLDRARALYVDLGSPVDEASG